MAPKLCVVGLACLTELSLHTFLTVPAKPTLKSDVACMVAPLSNDQIEAAVGIFVSGVSPHSDHDAAGCGGCRAAAVTPSPRLAPKACPESCGPVAARAAEEEEEEMGTYPGGNTGGGGACARACACCTGTEAGCGWEEYG